MKVKLNTWQSKVALDDHRFKVICAGRRAGKSVYSRMQVLKWSVEQPGLYWIVSPTYKQSKMIHWRDIVKEIPQDWIVSKNEVELSIRLKNGSIIELKGAENPDSLRGVKLNGLVVDEIASIRNWDWLWQEVLRATLLDYNAPAIFISTPKGFNHFYELYEMGTDGEGEYKSWRFTSYDNEFIPKESIDATKEEYRLSEQTYSNVWYQEYMAEFRKYTGLIYKEFERDIHIVEPFDIPTDWDILRGFDFGSTNPTVCLWIAVDKDENLWIVDEYYESNRKIDYIAGKVNSNQFNKQVTDSWGDPSGAQWITEFADRGVYITPAVKETRTGNPEWVRLGIERVREKLSPVPGHFVAERASDNQPSLFVFDNCENTIREFEAYRWREKSVTQAQDLNEPDVPDKANDHAMDALRYVVVSYRAFPQEPFTEQWDEKAWRIGK